MGLTEEDLDFRICQTDKNGNLETILGRAAHFTMAMAAYEAALEVYPNCGISVLHRARQIRHRPAQGLSGKTDEGR